MKTTKTTKKNGISAQPKKRQAVGSKMSEKLREFLEQQLLTVDQCQSHFDIVLQVCNRLLVSFGIKEVSLIKYTVFNGKLTVKPLHEEDFSSLPGFNSLRKPDILNPSRSMLKDLRHALVANKIVELEEGVYSIEVDAVKYNGFLLKSAGDSGSMVLMAAASGKNSKGGKRVKANGFMDWLDYCVFQWQQITAWMSQVVNAQSLIYRDDLTGLYNYRYLELIIDSEIKRAQRFGQEFSLLFIDIDNFKQVNDNFGHLNGSMVLQQLANVLRDVLREIDIIIRYGGDEFVVILLGTPPSRGFMVAERLRKLVEKHMFTLTTGEKHKLTISTGIAAFPKHAKSKQMLLHLADQSMYKSKRKGKNLTTVVVEAGHDQR